MGNRRRKGRTSRRKVLQKAPQFCGEKKIYETIKLAKMAASNSRKGSGDQNIEAYPCRDDQSHYHLGHNRHRSPVDGSQLSLANVANTPVAGVRRQKRSRPYLDWQRETVISPVGDAAGSLWASIAESEKGIQ